MRRLLAVALAVVSIGWGVAGASLTILYTNDLHLRSERLDSLGGLIARERDAAGGNVLLLDAGDAFQDFRTPLAAVWGADAMVKWMNEVGYDAMALGNHDLYWGSARLVRLLRAASFPALCANLRPAAGYTAPFAASAMRVVNGLRILLIGLITAEYLPYPDYPWLSWTSTAPAVEGVLAEEGPADLVIVVCHLSIADATRIAESVPGVDVLVTGHSHETTPVPVQAGNAVIVQSGAFGRYLGRLVLEVEPDGSVAVTDNALLPTEKAPVRVGRGLLQLLGVVAAAAATLAVVFLL